MLYWEYSDLLFLEHSAIALVYSYYLEILGGYNTDLVSAVHLQLCQPRPVARSGRSSKILSLSMRHS